MKNLVLQYFENSNKGLTHNLEEIIYSDELNLSVDKFNIPVITTVKMETQTFTRTYNEVSDSDNDRTNILMNTVTRTASNSESTDSDNDIRMNLLVATQTLTESQEVTDSDK